ncbi:MAG: hemerythrin domain-containing protein [Dehalococcoidia bacterium]|nr:hemerythrin domain-containing protein [Dehalococcoidia bacterium]
MGERLDIIRKVIDEHVRLTGGIKLVGESVSDLEAYFSLQKAGAELISGRPESLAEKQERLRKTFSYLNEGLRNHFAFEEKNLPPLMGELLMQALKQEHDALLAQLEEAQRNVEGIDAAEPDRSAQLAARFQMRQAVERLLQSVDEHAAREETVLNMIRSALEARD